jgi:hypothetical protein
MSTIIITKDPEEKFYKDEGGNTKINSQELKFKIVSKKKKKEEIKIYLCDTLNTLILNPKNYLFELWFNDNDKKEPIKDCYSFNVDTNKEIKINFRHKICSSTNQNCFYYIKLSLKNNYEYSNNFKIFSKKRKKKFSSLNEPKKIKNNLESINNCNSEEKKNYDIINHLNEISKSIINQNKILEENNKLLTTLLNDKGIRNNVLHITNNNYGCSQIIQKDHTSSSSEEDTLSNYPIL